MRQTLEQIRQEGLAALRERLGRAGMVRFLQQFETGSGDYAVERHTWVNTTSLDEIRTLAARAGKKSRTRRRKKS